MTIGNLSSKTRQPSPGATVSRDQGESGGEGGVPPWSGRGSVVVGLTVTGYLVVSLVLHHNVLTAFTKVTVGEVDVDSHLFIWWLTWFPHSLVSGENPLFTTAMHAPAGVNGVWNTTMPMLSAVLAPVTVTAGPIAAYNLGMILGPVASGTTLFLVLRAYVSGWAPRALAGLLYGFSPFVTAHTYFGHLNLVWSVLPPILLWAVKAIFIRADRPVRDGALLGLAFAVQTGLYTQTVALGAIAFAVTGGVLAARWPRQAVARLRPVLTAGVACCSVYAVLCAYPLYLLLAGPGRPQGQIRNHEGTGTDIVNLIIPSHLTHFRLGTEDLAPRLGIYTGEQGAYIGVPILVVLTGAALFVRNRSLRLTAAVATVLLVLSLGVTLIVLGRHPGVPLPWRLLAEVPLIGQAEAWRVPVFVALCVAFMMALLWQHFHAGPARPAGLAAITLVVAASCTWLPANAQRTRPADTPSFFTGAGVEQIRGHVIETVPRATCTWHGGATPLLWQAVSTMAYRTTGGYFIGSDATSPVLFEAPPGPYQEAVAAILHHRPVTTTPDTAADWLRAHDVDTVLVADLADVDETPLLGWTSEVTGSPARRVDDVWLFTVVAT